MKTKNIFRSTFCDFLSILVQVMKSASSASFGKMADHYCTHITRMLSQSSCSRVDVVFDQYRKQSIKEGERQKRGQTSSLEVKIYSDSMPIPKQWGKYIANPRNKDNLVDFLCCALCKRLTQSLNPQQKVFLAVVVVVATLFREGNT